MTQSVPTKTMQRGNSARSVSAIPLRGWIDVLKRTWAQVQTDNVFLISAGVGFYFLLALAPALTAFSAIATLLLHPEAMRDLLEELARILPNSTATLLTSQLETVLRDQQQETALSIKAASGLLLSFWAAAAAVRALMTAVTVAYRETEQRSFWQFHLTALALTLAALVIGLFAIVAFVLIPLALTILPFSASNETLIRLIRWPVIIGAVMVGLTVTYRFGPSRRQAKARWVTTGALAASILWLGGSLLFTTYVERLADYEAVHGALSSIVVLLLWFWFSAVVAILGAELNAELEHQTSVDTTIGKDRPMGQRGAYVADHVARKQVPSS